MPQYIYQNPKTKVTIEIIQSVHDDHEYTDKNGLKWNSFDAQLQYLWWELQNSESGALSKLKLENDPESAAYTFAKYFERPSEIASTRMQNATRIYDTYTNDIIKRIE